jgi:hypothetical protein
MKAKHVLALVLVLVGVGAFQLSQPLGAEGDRGQSVYLNLPKIEEAEPKTQLQEPNFGYAGDIGTIAATTKNARGIEAHADFVVHNYPDQDNLALGCTKLKYVGPKHLGNVDGWVFNTEWDGKNYPSKIFVSAQRIYFGGGRQAYIAADYRNETGWAWKMVPLRRMELTGNETR